MAETSRRSQPPRRATLAKRLRGKRVLVCVGAGGVGKTTTSAALALGLALRGQKVVVVTIDPARRLASALGLAELPSEPQRIEPALFAQQGLPVEGELWAMMLDAKRTFDELITRLSPDERTREEILANSVYAELSTAVAGSHELSAIAKLYELYEEHDFDVIVLDTPPSRNALDFLDAPGRLLGFLEGKALQVFLGPSGLTARMFGRGTALVFGIFARVTGVDMLGDLSTFFRSLSGVLDGFGERTRNVSALLRAPSTTFMIVTSPEAEPAREAEFLLERLAASEMPVGELIVNRVNTYGLHGLPTHELAGMLAPKLGEQLATRVSANLADFDLLAERDRQAIAHVTHAWGAGEPIVVPQLDEDVQDLLGLARIAEHLFD
ncbi:MAG TPA: ArsA-related P-loop ATPase [Solirubrobacteraceae bacterium]|jgi:anion-transporting  ArsA/GET3 family ATPase|nr:ArsA-related P-loop ATPase [Solirubrobacteraceae bacterium]